MDRDRAPALILRERLKAQLLAGAPADDPVSATGRLLAIQAQDEHGMRLAIRARTIGLIAADVDRALSEERSLVVAWLNRGTLHLVAREDYAWLHALTTPTLFARNARRLRQEGVSEQAAERGVDVIVRALTEEGPLSRAQLGERIAAAGVRTEGQALVHLLALANHRGLTVRGPLVDGQPAYVLVDDWIGSQPTVQRTQALAELARRYLAGHAPADERDLARWSGLPVRDAHAGLRGIASQLAHREDGLLELAAAGGRAVECPLPRLLGAFEPVLLGWSSRELVLGEHESAVVSGGVFRAFAIADGTAAALWRLARGKIAIEPLTELSDEHAAALRADAEDVLRFLGRRA